MYQHKWSIWVDENTCGNEYLLVMIGFCSNFSDYQQQQKTMSNLIFPMSFQTFYALNIRTKYEIQTKAVNSSNQWFSSSNTLVYLSESSLKRFPFIWNFTFQTFCKWFCCHSTKLYSSQMREHHVKNLA